MSRRSSQPEPAAEHRPSAASALLAFRDLIGSRAAVVPDFDDFADEPVPVIERRVAACVVCGCWPTDPAEGCASTCPCHTLFD